MTEPKPRPLCSCEHVIDRVWPYTQPVCIHCGERFPVPWHIRDVTPSSEEHWEYSDD